MLNGNSGSLITVLDAVLGNGYGSQPAAGWSKPFSSSFIAVYYPTGSAASKMYYQIIDNTNITQSAMGQQGGKIASIKGFENMVSATSGSVYSFPPLGQAPFIYKSATTGTTQATASRPWVAAADGRTCLLFTGPNYTTASNPISYFGHYFGEIYSFKSGDVYQSIIIGVADNSSSVAALGSSGHEITDNAGSTPHSETVFTTNNGYIARSYDEFPLAITFALSSPSGFRYRLGYDGFLNRTNPADNGIYTTDIFVCGDTPLNHIRGKLRGLKVALHSGFGWADSFFFNGSGIFSGSRFEILKGENSIAGNDGRFCIEITDTVESN